MLIGKCSSEKCNPIPKDVKKSLAERYIKFTDKVTTRDFSKAPNFCSDCGEALFYIRLKKEEHDRSKKLKKLN